MGAEVATSRGGLRRFARRIAGALLLLFCTAVGAQVSPEVARGIGWLAGQVQPNGTLAGEAGSVASAFQSRSEAAQTLKQLATLPAALADAIAAESDANTEYLSRKAVGLGLAGRDATPAVNGLLFRQNDDGGFGGQAGYESNALDTAFALIAFKAASQNGPVSRALAYLQNAQAADGSYSVPGRPDIEASAYAAIALRLFASQFNVATAAQRAVSYLQSQQSAQLWGDSVFLSALAYDAIHDFVALEPTATTVRNFLLARQAADGSWDAGDPYATALALRALVLTATASANPTLAVVKGRVADAQTGLALAGVAVALSGAATGSRTTAADGVFEFRELTPGSYALQLSLTDYNALSISTSAKAGELQDLGTLQLGKGQGATSGTVRGIVKDASTDQPLAGATVLITGGASALTDAAGAYQIPNVAPGSIAVQASKTGYASVSGAGNLAAGGVLVFSPALAPGVNNATATLMGRATGATDGAPLAGVTIAVTGASNAIAVTDAEGLYSLKDLNAGLIQVRASKAGFDSVNGAITIVGNSTITFSPRMYATGTTPPAANASRVSGTVVDAGTRQPIAGATVSSSNGPAVLTGTDGRFTFEGSGTTQELTFAASGYQGGSLALNWGLAGLSELGEIGLIRSGDAELLPDLTVSKFARQGMVSDPQTRAASGTVSVIVANVGNALTQRPATVTVFEDRNSDGRFDPALDLAVGSGTLPAGLGVGELPVPIALSGTLLFRDNALHAALDRENDVAESNEDNNVKPSSCSPFGLPYIDNFNDGAADGWLPLVGRGGAPLSVVDGELVRPSNGASYTGSTAWTDYSAEIKLRFPQGIGNDAGLVFRARNPNDWYSVRMQSGLQRLMKFFGGGNFQVLRQSALPLLNDPSRPHTLKVDVAGQWMRAYLNGQFLFEHEGLEWEAGAVGTEQDGVLVHYDDLRVMPLAVLEDFNDGNADGWRPLSYGSTAATVINGEYVRTSYGSSMYGSTSWRNYTAEVKLRFPNGMGNDGGLVILAKDSANWVHTSINGGLIRFAVPGAGVVRQANVALNNDPNFWHTLKAEVRGRSVKWYLNGQFLFDYDNLPWENGAVGTIQDGVLVHYDDLKISFAEPSEQPDLTGSYLRIEDGGTAPSKFIVRIGNGGSAVAPTGVRVAFYNGSALLGTALTTRALQAGQFEDVTFLHAGPLTSLSEIVAVVDDNGAGVGLVAECDETNNRVSLPLSVVPGVFAIQVVTDQTSYGANADVLATATVANLGSLSRPAQVRFKIETGDGAAAVTTLPLPAPVTVLGAAAQNVTATWNTGSTFAGSYRARTELVDAFGAPTAAAVAPFAIVSGVTETVASRAITDKQTYAPSETVNLTARITNTTANQPLDNLRIVTTILNPDGSVRFTQVETLPQLAQGALRDYAYSVALALAPAGTYSAVVTVQTAAGEMLATGTSSFSVLSSSATGSGLGGTLAAAPKAIPFRDPVALSVSVINRGNSAQAALPVVLRVVDPGTQSVLAEYARTVDIAQGASVAFGETWPSTGSVGAAVVAVLSATVAGTSVTLAQDTITIAPPAVRLTGNLSVVPSQVPQGEAVSLTQTVQNAGYGTVSAVPVRLAIVNNATGQTAAEWVEAPTLAPGAVFQAARSFIAEAPVGTTFSVTLSATISGAATLLAQDSFSVIAPPVRVNATLETLREGRVLALVSCKPEDASGNTGADEPACRDARAAFLDAYLTRLGVTHLVTTDTESFRRALRSGQYNVYWISGGADRLQDTLAEEVREAVFRGDALLLDGVHDERNGLLDPAVGVLYRGKLSPTDQPVSVNGSLFAAGMLASAGRPLKVDLAGGEAQAQFAAAQSAPAIVSRSYGLGRGLLFAYDLVGTLMAQPSDAQDALVSAGLGWLRPNLPATASGFEYSVLRARIENLGQAVELRVTLTPPQGSTVLSTAPQAAPDASGRPVWSFMLAVDETKDLFASLRLPGSTGTYAASINVESVRNGVAHPYGTFETSITVEDAASVSARSISGLMALSVGSADKADRNHAVAAIQSAQARLAAGQYESAIADLVAAAERLLKITSVDVGPYRVEVARLLKEAEARWAAAQP